MAVAVKSFVAQIGRNTSINREYIAEEQNSSVLMAVCENSNGNTPKKYRHTVTVQRRYNDEKSRFIYNYF